MRDPKDIQADLDAAQASLESDLAQLKHLIEDKLETPKHVIEVVEKPFVFAKHHALLIGVVGAFGLGLLMGRAFTR
ncbi:MAG: hypothetical protein QM831_24760 [Kofleriaceae bacterium]